MKKKKVQIGISQKTLIIRRFFKHRLAVISLGILAFFYILAIFPGFISPYAPDTRFSDNVFAAPSGIHFFDTKGNFSIRPFIYGKTVTEDPVTWESIYTIDPEKKIPIKFFVQGDSYKFLGLWKCNRHLFNTGDPENPVFIFGSDKLGRDLFSRVIFGSSVSLTIGLVGVFVSLVLGVIIGGFAGLCGGIVDSIVGRLSEILMSFPEIPLWLALSAALPPHWSMIKVYFGITVVLAFLGWPGIARVIRTKFMSLREEDFVQASVTFGAGNWWVIRKHLIPSFASYLIVAVTMSVPGMILGETALSFLGLGLRPPAVSWGVLLQDAQNVKTLAMNPWLMIPGVCVIIVVLAYNFIGDGLRDAVDPYSK